MTNLWLELRSPQFNGCNNILVSLSCLLSPVSCLRILLGTTGFLNHVYQVVVRKGVATSLQNSQTRRTFRSVLSVLNVR
jgi:hypothetical protein